MFPIFTKKNSLLNGKIMRHVIFFLHQNPGNFKDTGMQIFVRIVIEQTEKFRHFHVIVTLKNESPNDRDVSPDYIIYMAPKSHTIHI